LARNSPQSAVKHLSAIKDLDFLCNTYKEYFRQFIFIKKFWFIKPKFAITANGSLASMVYKYTFIDEFNLTSNRDIPSLWSFSAQLNFGCSYLLHPKLAISIQTSILQFNKSPNYSNSSPKPLDHSIDFLDPNNRLMFGLNYIIGKSKIP
jgi:hypothetical protein